MAWTELLHSGRYRGMYRDATGTRKSVGTYPKKAQALGKATAAEDSAKSRPASSSMTWGEWETIWTPTRKVEQSTLQRDESRLANHLRPKWSDVALAAITTSKLQTWIDEDLSHLSPSTQRKIVAVMSSSLKAAGRRDLIPSNPCSGLEFPSLEPSPERWLNAAEVQAIRDVLDPRYSLTYELLVGTGMRWGEAVALHWDDVDLTAKVIKVRMSWDRNNRYFKPTKSRQTRDIPLGESLVGLLRTELSKTGLGTPPQFEYRGVGKPRYALVLGQRPPEPKMFTHGLEAAGRAAFIGEDGHRRRVGKVRPHDLRHTYASHLVQSGISITTASALLGHSSLTVTQRYAQTGRSEWDAVRGATL